MSTVFFVSGWTGKEAELAYTLMRSGQAKKVKCRKEVNVRIDSAFIGMESARKYSSSSSKSMGFNVFSARSKFLKQNKEMADLSDNEKTDKNTTRETTADKRKEVFEKLNNMGSYSKSSRISGMQETRDMFSSMRDKCFQYLIDIFYGEGKVNYGSLMPVSADDMSSGMNADVYSLSMQTYYEEQESTSFSTIGTVKCADGREISFNLEVQMSRKFSAYYEENIEFIKPRLCDPLVINLEGNVAQMSDQKFFFDIDADGEKDEISMLGQGSGYLALDKNSDGVINDGSELFGTKSGNGFSDLRAYDSDGNGWIDESDEIWSKLLIWTKDENGKDTCYRLADKNVGAICLSNASTDFSLNSSDNTTNGVIRNTGIFLYENGNVGTVQHLDVAR